MVGPLSPQSGAPTSPSLVAGPAALGAHITPPGAALGHVAGTGPPLGHPAQGQTLRSPQGAPVKMDTSDSTAVSPRSSESQGDGVGSPSGTTKRPISENQPVAAANPTEPDSGDDKTVASNASASSGSTGMSKYDVLNHNTYYIL